MMATVAVAVTTTKTDSTEGVASSRVLFNMQSAINVKCDMARGEGGTVKTPTHNVMSMVISARWPKFRGGNQFSSRYNLHDFTFLRLM